MPYIAEEGIVETFIIAYLSNSIKGLLRNRKTGVLSLTDVLPNTEIVYWQKSKHW